MAVTELEAILADARTAVADRHLPQKRPVEAAASNLNGQADGAGRHPIPKEDQDRAAIIMRDEKVLANSTQRLDERKVRKFSRNRKVLYKSAEQEKAKTGSKVTFEDQMNY